MGILSRAWTQRLSPLPSLGGSAGRGDKGARERVDDPRPGREEQALDGQWPWGGGLLGLGRGQVLGTLKGQSQSLGMGNTLRNSINA